MGCNGESSKIIDSTVNYNCSDVIYLEVVIGTLLSD